MKIFKQLIIVLSVALSVHPGCDSDLFKSDDEGQDPQVGEIISDRMDLDVHVGDTVNFWISASDPDGGILQYLWDCTGGTFISTPDGDSVIWRAPFQGGNYSLQVRVSNKSKNVTRSKIIRVISFEKPVVHFISPRSGDFLIQHNAYTLVTEAFHDNGISTVRIYVNDVLAGTCKEIQPSLFRLDWIADVPSGWTELKAVAEAQTTAAQNQDSIQVSVEGVIPGKQ